MNALHVKPLRRVLVGTVVLSTLLLGCGVWLLGRTFGRRAGDDGGPLASALQLAAQQETSRLQTALAQRRTDLDAALASMLRVTQTDAPPDAPVRAQRDLCEAVKLPEGVTRAGVIDVESGELIAWLEPTDKGCVDRWWSLAVMAISGPPFPAPADVEWMAQAAVFGMEHAVEGTTSLVGAWREGVFASLRLAQGDGRRAAFIDFKLSELPGPPPVKGVRVDSFVTVGGVVMGYIHGGPGIGMVPAAVKRIKAGRDRVLTLPDVIDAAASRAVLATVFPEEADGGDLALATHQLPLAGTAPFPIRIGVVTSAPWPAATWETRGRLLGLLLLVVVSQALLLLLVTRRLARALNTIAHRVRAAWMVAHDDVENPDDDERARRLVNAMEQGTRDTLEASFGGGGRYWSAGPLQRLMDVIRAKLGRRG